MRVYARDQCGGQKSMAELNGVFRFCPSFSASIIAGHYGWLFGTLECDTDAMGGDSSRPVKLEMGVLMSTQCSKEFGWQSLTLLTYVEESMNYEILEHTHSNHPIWKVAEQPASTFDPVDGF
ncbi:hypothetical protein EDD85DRAFT_941982 [Armillaria nabsnona]|nr:hypothetical protein EDD85DRAFT_941982 [Armillaria nabsnona]